MLDQMRFTHENANDLLLCVKESSETSICKSLFVNSLRQDVSLKSELEWTNV
jgi:hypothetical protein